MHKKNKKIKIRLKASVISLHVLVLIGLASFFYKSNMIKYIEYYRDGRLSMFNKCISGSGGSNSDNHNICKISDSYKYDKRDDLDFFLFPVKKRNDFYEIDKLDRKNYKIRSNTGEYEFFFRHNLQKVSGYSFLPNCKLGLNDYCEVLYVTDYYSIRFSMSVYVWNNPDKLSVREYDEMITRIFKVENENSDKRYKTESWLSNIYGKSYGEMMEMEIGGEKALYAWDAWVPDFPVECGHDCPGIEYYLTHNDKAYKVHFYFETGADEKSFDETVEIIESFKFFD
ncbi:hypothetical protein ACFL1M_01780 [Patescibacteria group bacterium]